MHITKLSFALLLSAFVGNTLAESITPVKPKWSSRCYQIGTAAELYGFAAIVNGTDGMTKNTKACGKLTANIVINKNVIDSEGNLSSDSSEFIPWTAITDFAGTFDGQGHTISGLYINDEDKKAVLFGSVETDEQKVSIQNLGIIGSYFSGFYTSSLVGRTSGDSLYIENCFSTATLNSDGAGGLIDYAERPVHVNNSYYFGRFVNPKKSRRNSCIVGSNNKHIVTNSFCVDSIYAGYGGTGLSTEKFNNGTVATLLHYSVNGSIWGQTVGTDKSPNFSKSISGATALTTWNITLVTYAGDTEKRNIKYIEGYGLALPEISREGYHFDGWFAKQDYSDTVVTEVSSEAKGNLTFYAKWSKYPKLVNNCYEIGTAEELYGFSYLASGDFLASPKSFCGKLTADIVVNTNVLKADGSLNGDGSNLTPWNQFLQFTGTFDGQGHTISGLYFNDTTAWHIGFFGSVDTYSDKDSTVIKNLGIIDSYFKGQEDIGGLIGLAFGNKLAIYNCYSKATVIATKRHAGGLIGESDASWLYIKESFNVGYVSAYEQAAGLLGYYHHFTGVPNKMEVYNSYNAGSIEGRMYVSGLIAYNIVSWLTIKDSYNTGAVSGNMETAGIISYNSDEQKNTSSTTLINVYNTGDISGNIGVAGIVAKNSRNLTVDSSFNKGKVSGSFNVGGIVANTNAPSVSVSNSFNEGKLQKTETKNLGRAAGIVATNESGLSLWNTYNHSDIDADTNSCGGLVAKTTKDLKIVNSYNNGELKCHADSLDPFVGVSADTVIVTVTHSYHLDSYASPFGESASAKNISNGVLASKLSSYSDSIVDGSIWTQNVGTVDHPVLKLTAYTAPEIPDDEHTTSVAKSYIGTKPIHIDVIGRSIHVSGTAPQSRYTIFDVHGNQIQHGFVGSATITIPRAGNYIIRIGNQFQSISVR